MKEKALVGMIGLRGYGNMVRQGIKQSSTMQLAAIWSRDAESVARSQKELPCKACDTYEDLLKESIDAVLIINPNYLHVEYGLKAAEAGKAALIEKPITNTIEEGRQLVAAFKKKGLLLGAKHLHRYTPISRKIGEMIRNGDLGKILSAEAYTSHSTSKTFPPDRWKRNPLLCPAAPMTQLGVHYIDTAISWFGHPKWVQSTMRNVLKLSDNIDCSVSTICCGDVPFTVHAHYVVPSYSRMAVYGTEGVLVWDEHGVNFKKEGSKSFAKVDVQEGDGLVDVLNAFGKAICTKTHFETDGEEALFVVAVAEGAIKSAGADGVRVFIDKNAALTVGHP